MSDTIFIVIMYLVGIAAFGLVVSGSSEDESIKKLFNGFIFVIILLFVVLFLLDKKNKKDRINKPMENTTSISIEQQDINTVE
jgi:putative copper export protein